MKSLIEAARLGLEYIEEVDYGPYDSRPIIAALRQAVEKAENKDPWVSLTDEEIDMFNITGNESLREFVRAIEAKLKEKNT